VSPQIVHVRFLHGRLCQPFVHRSRSSGPSDAVCSVGRGTASPPRFFVG
jgi:hypothetical protein